MKTMIFTFALLLGSFAGYNQTAIQAVRDFVPNEEMLKNWDKGETKTFENSQVTKLTDDFENLYRTNVHYQSAKACTRVSGGEVLTSSVSYTGVKDNMITTDGQLYIFIDRTSADAANMKHFTVSILDAKTNAVLYRVQLDAAAPRHFKHDIFYNAATINLPRGIGNNFQVIIEDHFENVEIGYYVQGGTLEAIDEIQYASR